MNKVYDTFFDTSFDNFKKGDKMEKDKEQIYISGPMSNIENYNFEEFMKAEDKFEGKYIVINPAKISKALCKSFGKSLNEIPKETYMKEDIRLLLNCDIIYMLEDWEKSEGAILEHEIAKQIGLKIIYK